MIYNIFFFFIGFVAFGGMALFFGVFFYTILFEAEKMRQKMVALPEYKQTWVFWATPYKPFKWWHLYRKAVFIYQIDPVFIPKRQRQTSIAARKIIEIMPRHLKNLYKVQDSALGFSMIALVISHFLH